MRRLADENQSLSYCTNSTPTHLYNQMIMSPTTGRVRTCDDCDTCRPRNADVVRFDRPRNLSEVLDTAIVVNLDFWSDVRTPHLNGCDLTGNARALKFVVNRLRMPIAHILGHWAMGRVQEAVEAGYRSFEFFSLGV